MIRRPSYFIFLVLFSFYPGISLSGEKCYQILEKEVYLGRPSTPENEHPVCQVLLDNLNEFCEKPMVCEFKIHPKYSSQLTLPNWTKLDIHKNLDKIKAMQRTPREIWEVTKENRDSQDKSWPEYYAKLKIGIDDNTATLHQAKFDLYNLGKSYEVFRVEFGKCTGKTIILDPLDDPKVAARRFERSRVDIEYTGEILRKLLTPKTAYIIPLEAVFFFKGQTFAYSWYQEELWVFRPLQQPDGFFNKEGLCRFGYRQP